MRIRNFIVELQIGNKMHLLNDMKLSLYTLFLAFVLLFFTNVVQAQKTMGILQYEVHLKKPVSRQIVDSIHIRLSKQKWVMHSTYSLSDDELTFHPELSANQAEQTVNQLMFYQFNIYENYHPKLVVNRDEEGKISWVGFVLNAEAEIKTKIIDLPTNTIGAIQVAKLKDALPLGSLTKGINRVQLTDYKKRFMGDPDALRKKSNSVFQERLKKAHKDMAPKFRKFYRAKLDKVYNSISGVELNYYIPGPLVCEDMMMEKEKLKRHDSEIALSNPNIGRINAYFFA